MFGYSPKFKATKAWDYKALKEGVFSALEEMKYPTLVSDTAIEDLVAARGDIPVVIGSVRFRHCISRALRSAGYVKRSERGHAWDWSFDSEWEPRMDICPSCENDITLRNTKEGIILCPVCNHKIKSDCR